MPSKVWLRRYDDPAATKLCWYCCDCGGRYKTNYGTVIELRLNNDVYVAKAEIPFGTFKDVKAAVLEANTNGTSIDNRLSEVSVVLGNA